MLLLSGAAFLVRLVLLAAALGATALVALAGLLFLVVLAAVAVAVLVGLLAAFDGAFFVAICQTRLGPFIRTIDRLVKCPEKSSRGTYQKSARHAGSTSATSRSSTAASVGSSSTTSTVCSDCAADAEATDAAGENWRRSGMLLQETRLDLVRVGIALYGLWQVPEAGRGFGCPRCDPLGTKPKPAQATIHWKLQSVYCAPDPGHPCRPGPVPSLQTTFRPDLRKP